MLEASMKDAEDRIRKLLRSGELDAGEAQEWLRNVRHIGEFAFGVDPAAKITGNLLNDEKIGETIHIALGHNYSRGENRAWTSTHYDLISEARTVVFHYRDKTRDPETVLENGKWVLSDVTREAEVPEGKFGMPETLFYLNTELPSDKDSREILSDEYWELLRSHATENPLLAEKLGFKEGFEEVSLSEFKEAWFRAAGDLKIASVGVFSGWGHMVQARAMSNMVRALGSNVRILDILKLIPEHAAFWTYMAAAYDHSQVNLARKQKGLPELPFPDAPQTRNFSEWLAVKLIQIGTSGMKGENILKRPPEIPAPLARFAAFVQKRFIDGIASRELEESYKRLGGFDGIVTTHSYGAKVSTLIRKMSGRIVNAVPDPGHMHSGSGVILAMTARDRGVLNMVSDPAGEQLARKAMGFNDSQIFAGGTVVDPEAMSIAEKYAQYGLNEKGEPWRNLDKKYRSEERRILLTTSGNGSHMDQISWALEELADSLKNRKFYTSSDGKNRWRYKVYVYLGNQPDENVKLVRDTIKLLGLEDSPDLVVVDNRVFEEPSALERLQKEIGFIPQYQDVASIKFLLQAHCHVELGKPGENPMTVAPLGTDCASWRGLSYHETVNIVHAQDEWESAVEAPKKEGNVPLLGWLNGQFDSLTGKKSLSQTRAENGFNRAPHAAAFLAGVFVMEKALGVFDAAAAQSFAGRIYNRGKIEPEQKKLSAAPQAE
ncbi:MAG TPA: hypothetical protein VJC03_08235, partial [bacterium]|nr:hypothetical protein [bacterium]